MKWTILTLMVALFGMLPGQPGPQNTKEPASADNEAAVRAVVLHWQQSWENFDASVLQGDYTDDADWLNAFGVRIKGGPKIVEFVSRVVKRSNVQGRQTKWEEPVVRLVRPDVAVAYRDYKTVGHKTFDGTEMPLRTTHSTWFLIKESGKWRITSQVISDDNTAAAPAVK